MDENKKMMIGVFLAALIVVGVGYKLVEASVTGRVDFDLETENINPSPVDTENQREYSKMIDNVQLKLTVPDEWNYEEIQKK